MGNATCFIGHAFVQDKLDDFRDAINIGTDYGKIVEPVYSDFGFHGELFPKIKSQIDGALFCVFEISEGNPNVFIEIGYAIGRQKAIVIMNSVELTSLVISAGSNVSNTVHILNCKTNSLRSYKPS